VADGHQRDGTQAREQVNAKLRFVLSANHLAHTVIYGIGPARTQAALDAVAHHRKKPLLRSAHDTVWRWPCDTCANAECEHRLFGRLL
jgi:hypothetical protein